MRKERGRLSTWDGRLWSQHWPDFVGLVDIGNGRKMYVECSGTGSPTVVLISGKGNGAADWSEILDSAERSGMEHALCEGLG